MPDGRVAEGLGDVGLADADRAVKDDRLAGVQHSAARSRICAAGSFGDAWKSKPSKAQTANRQPKPSAPSAEDD
jgi:hypothetical protein